MAIAPLQELIQEADLRLTVTWTVAGRQQLFLPATAERFGNQPDFVLCFHAVRFQEVHDGLLSLIDNLGRPVKVFVKVLVERSGDLNVFRSDMAPGRSGWA